MSSSSLKVGIVGLPNCGKSTLFNALVARRLSPTAAHPFTTIKPYEAVVAVPDERLTKLTELIKPEKAAPATVTFVDIAGLVKGANLGEGLGNQFLSYIREVDAIIHVVRAFEDDRVVHISGKIDPKQDLEVVNLELELGGIVGKPTIYVLNVSENQLNSQSVNWQVVQMPDPKIIICAKLEEELSDLKTDERREYLKQLGTGESGLEKLIKQAYKLLGLITFYTVKGGRQVHAWSIKQGSKAQEAAGKVHTDFAKNFIRAQVIEYEKLIEAGSFAVAKQKGLIRTEGKDYEVKDGDVVEFLVSS